MEEQTCIDYKVGEEYTFTVNRIYATYCELLDACGLKIYLQNTKRFNLVKNQTIRCRVLANTQLRPQIAVVDEESLIARKSHVSEAFIEEIWKLYDTEWNTKEFAKLLLMVERESDFENECRRWIGALNNAKANLETIRTDCTSFLEESDFLSRCDANERELYQQRLTLLIELLGYYIGANNLLAEDKALDYIDELFQRLKSSGYVYHPSKKFNIMSCIFLLQKDLMQEKMQELFDILRQWGLEIWTKEPFNSTLVKVLELYIKEYIWKTDKVRDNASLLHNLIQALSIQLLLSESDTKKDDSIDQRLNLSRLYTLSTYENQLKAASSLMSSLAILANNQFEKPAYSIEDTGTNKISYLISYTKPFSIEATCCYIHGKAKLEVSPKGIILYACTGENSKPLLPKELGLFGGLQVVVDRRFPHTINANPTITECKQLWKEIQKNVFANNTPTVTRHRPKLRHHVEDTVTISVTAQSETDARKIYCKIEDEFGGEGYMYIKDIVPYNLQADIRYFQSENGKSLLFEAKIIDEEDGKFHFSMLESVKEFAKDFYDADELIACSLGTDKPANSKGRIPAVSPDGISVSLGGFSECEYQDFRKNDVVMATVQREGPGTFHIECRVEDISQYWDFNIGSAFHTLMKNYALGEDESELSAAEESSFQENDKILDAEYVKEIVRIIERMSIINNEYVKSYNYFGFARILCLMIGWEEQASYYQWLMELISMLHDFAINDIVDENRLNNLQKTNADIFRNSAILYDRFLQLQIVSYKGKRESDEELWKLYTANTGKVKEVASLVLAYNMAIRNNMVSQSYDFQNRIKLALSIKGYESNLMTYGTGIEDKDTEYKTSIVFPPDENMKPNLPKQMKNIMKVLAAFLNTNGGTLYIGVNDAGAGVGIEDDLNSPYFNGDKDKYLRTIQDEVALKWGNLISTYIDVDFDRNNTDKDVVIVIVRPYPDGVEFEDRWWVKTGNSKRSLNKEEFDKYNTQSRNLDAVHEPAPEVKTEEYIIENTVPDSPVDVMSINSSVTTETIPTSKNRLNVLESYSVDFRPYVSCLKIQDKGKFSKTTEYDFDPCMLNLAVYEEEIDSYLVLCYADGNMIKVPIGELLKFTDYSIHTRRSDSKLLFATIANDNDAIIGLIRENKSSARVVVRVDKVDKIYEGKLSERGCQACNDGIISEAVAYEMAPGRELPALKRIVDMDARTAGLPLKTLSNDLASKLRSLHVDMNLS